MNAKAAGRAWLAALVMALALTAGVPPGWVPGAALATLLGWAACYRLCWMGRPRRWAYIAGAVHVAAFSWSLHPVLAWAPVAIGAIGGGYFVLTVVWTRSLARIAAPLAFALAVAGCSWLRTVMPEIAYPHGQAAHSFYRWPAAMGAVAWGGEVLANLLVAGLAASLSEVVAPLRLQRRGGLLALAGFLGVAMLCCLVPAPRADRDVLPAVRVLAVQPGLAPGFQHGDLAGDVARWLVQPTQARAGAGSEPPFDLVAWPETTYPATLRVERGRGRLSASLPLALSRDTRLVAGTLGEVDGRRVPVAVLLDANGKYLDHHEKQRLVPAGEVIPFRSWLPRSLADWLNVQVAQSVGVYLDLEPGAARPPLRTAAGVPFAALLCYDNAFAAVAATAVEGGSRLLVVLSNEAWYEQGSELAQMQAMTVCRALETDTPIVRATIDGATIAVGADGRLLGGVPYGAAADGGARLLAVEVVPGPGRLRPLAWLARAVLGLVLLSSVTVLWRSLRSWARLLGVRSQRGPATLP